MIWLGMQFAFGLFLGLLALGIIVSIVGILSVTPQIIRNMLLDRRAEKELADRWKENANPFIGVP